MWPDHSEELIAEPLFYVRETIDAAEWEAAQTQEAAQPLYQVLVSGLPNLLASDQMCEAMIEQCGFGEALLGFKASQGMHGVNDGQVLVSLDSMAAAQWCAYYFHERQWGGAAVTAEVIAPSWEHCAELSDHDLGDGCDWAVTPDVVPDAPEFVPLSQHLHSFELPSAPQAEAGPGSAWLEEATFNLLQDRRKEARTATSSLDSTIASSQDGESESGDEVLFTKVGPVAAVPSRKVKG
jgi:hypothetical protein